MKICFYLTYMLLPAIVLLTACDVDAPIKEMARAKQSIARAYEVRADRYDAETLDSAENVLYGSHEELVNQKNKDAKKKAEESYSLAQKAIKKSLPLLARDSLKEAQELYKRAEKLNAEEYAPDEFNSSKKLLEEAGKLNTDKQYWESHLKSSEAAGFLNNAITASEKAAAQLELEIARLKAEHENLTSLDTKQTAQSELAGAADALAKAETSLKEDMVKDAETSVSEARQYLKVARLKVLALTLKERIAVLRANIENLKKERGDDFAPEEIEQALAALNEAESLMELEKPEEARDKLSEAENFFLAALLKTEKGLAQDKIASARALQGRIKNSDTKNKFNDEIEESESLLKEAEQQYKSEAYKEALNKASEAEKLLSSLTITMEKEYDTVVIQDEDVQIYIVKLNVKDRDCLWKIAHRLYKNARLWPLIYMANKDQIKDPDLIYPGQRFKIPPVPDKQQNMETESQKETTEDTPVKNSTQTSDSGDTVE